MGTFVNCFNLSNYEYSFKTPPQVEKKEKPDEDEDERSTIVKKTIPKYEIHTEDMSYTGKEDYIF